jgi:hypothetical protein
MERSDILPRVIGVKLAAEPFKQYVCVAGTPELARMIGLPEGIPERAVALQFITDFEHGKLRPKPILFGGRLECKCS